ncbi:MAG: hypothetical protein WAW13_03455 [Minisyncoccia bacterium]
MSTYNAVGWFGMITLLVSYGLVSNGVIVPTGYWYNIMNIVGGLTIAYSLLPLRAWPTIVLELCFVSIGLVAIVKLFF